MQQTLINDDRALQLLTYIVVLVPVVVVLRGLFGHHMLDILDRLPGSKNEAPTVELLREFSRRNRKPTLPPALDPSILCLTQSPRDLPDTDWDYLNGPGFLYLDSTGAVQTVPVDLGDVTMVTPCGCCYQFVEADDFNEGWECYEPCTGHGGPNFEETS